MVSPRVFVNDPFAWLLGRTRLAGGELLVAVLNTCELNSTLNTAARKPVCGEDYSRNSQDRSCWSPRTLVSVSLDILVYSEEEFDERAMLKCTLEYRILNEGIRVYG